MTDARARLSFARRFKCRARRWPLRPIGYGLVWLAGMAALATGDLTMGLLVVAALTCLVADRWAWKHTRTRELRSRYRALGARAEALDERLHALRDSEDAHRSLTETFGDLVAQVHDGRLTFANAGFQRHFPNADALPIETLAEDGEGVFETAEGPRVLNWRLLPALDAKGRAVERWIARDVTEIVEARERAEAEKIAATRHSETKSRFLAMAAHEIRNPLGGISGMADLLAASELDPHRQAQVGAIIRSTRALEGVIGDLLDDARMEADRLTIDCEPFDLGAMLEGVAELAAPRAHERKLDIALHVVRHGRDAVPGLVEGDAGRIRQIVTNLVGNALKFTETGGVTLLADIGDDGLQIAVTDTGPGLTDAEMDRIFDVFASGDDADEARRLARRLGGVGLGLGISRRLAKAMGGNITIASAPGEGSTFTLTLPMERAERPLGTALEGQSVLLVASSNILAGPLRRFVEERGGTLVVKRSAAEWDRGPVLVDEQADSRRPDGAVLLSRDAAEMPGSQRWLRLPWRAASLERALTGEMGSGEIAPATLRAEIDTGGPGLKVLVAEDDPVTQLLTTAVLERAGHRVTLAANGHDAARLYREAAEGEVPFDAAVLDLNMTVLGENGMDGFAALKGIRAIENARGMTAVPIHVVTGDAREDTAEEVVAAGATQVLVKPVGVDVLAGLFSETRKVA